MGAIDDTHKVLQDFMAPELRAISVRLDGLEKRMDGLDKRIDGFEQRTEARFDNVERRADKRHDEVMAAIRQVIDFNSIQQRLARLESKEAAHQ